MSWDAPWGGMLLTGLVAAQFGAHPSGSPARPRHISFTRDGPHELSLDVNEAPVPAVFAENATRVT
jgi:hypothetical protein